MICGTSTHPASADDFPKNAHYPVGCYRDGGENADGAEPAAGRAKQHLSESTDTKTQTAPTQVLRRRCETRAVDPSNNTQTTNNKQS
jgi:hypothetical protein